MVGAVKVLFAVFASGLLSLSSAAPGSGQDCRAEYDRKIHHINTALAQERLEVRRDRDRLERAYREHRGSRERRAELRREYEREKDKLRQLERHLRQRREDAKRELRECQERIRRDRR